MADLDTLYSSLYQALDSRTLITSTRTATIVDRRPTTADHGPGASVRTVRAHCAVHSDSLSLSLALRNAHPKRTNITHLTDWIGVECKETAVPLAEP